MILDASFELDNGSWTYTGGFGLESIDAAQASDGAKSLRLDMTHGFGGITHPGEAQSTEFDLMGNARPLLIDVWRPAGQVLGIGASLATTDGLFSTLSIDDVPAETWTEMSYVIPSTGLPTQLILASRWIGEFDTIASGYWRFDNVRLGAPNVAVKLAERSINAVVAALQTHLGTELGLIDTNRADGLTLTVPASTSYYKRPKPEIAGPEVQVCVFEGEFDFTNPYADADCERAVYQIPITVRVVLIADRGETAEVMVTRIRRYGCGVFNVLSKHPTLSGTDDAIKFAVCRAVRPSWDLDPEKDMSRKLSVEIPMTVTCEETQA